MYCERIQSSFLDHQRGLLSPTEAGEIHTNLKSCLACQREWSGLQETLTKLDRLPRRAPSSRMAEQFYLWLEEEQRDLETGGPFALARSRIDAFFARWLPARPLFQAAAGFAMLMIGLFAGEHLLSRNKATPTTPSATETQLLAELIDLRSRVDSMGQLVAYSLHQQQSGTRRLQSVLAAFDGAPSSDRILAELLHTLTFDPSTNVRLSALEALYAHADHDAVRAGVLAALPRERSPLIQVAMIDFVAAAQDRAAAPALEEITRTFSLDKAVREAAQRALVQL